MDGPDPSALRRILGIARAASSRGSGLSLRDALAQAEYARLRSCFESEDLVPLLRTDADLVQDWLAYSEDKRTSSGWYVLASGELGRVEHPAARRRFDDLGHAVAEYVVRELDYWAAGGGQR